MTNSTYQIFHQSHKSSSLPLWSLSISLSVLNPPYTPTRFDRLLLHITNMPIWQLTLAIAEFLQLLSPCLIYRHNKSRKSVAGISCDFTVLSLLSAACSAMSGLSYTILVTLRDQYAARYPVYPNINFSVAVLLIHIGQFTITSLLAWQVFVTHRKSIIGDEWLSLPCKAFLLLLLGFFLWLVSLFWRGRATINQLDLADCGWTIASITFGVRLLSQVTNNFWLERYALMHRNFIHVQFVSVVLAMITWKYMDHQNIQWHEVPANCFLRFVWIPNFVCLLGLANQFSSRNKVQFSPV